MRVLLSTRQELTDRGIRDHITSEAEELASNTNMTLISSSPFLTRQASMNAVQLILGGQWKVDATNYHKLYSDTTTLLNTWLASETDMSSIRNKHYYRIISKKPSIPKLEETLE